MGDPFSTNFFPRDRAGSGEKVGGSSESGGSGTNAGERRRKLINTFAKRTHRANICAYGSGAYYIYFDS